MKKFMDMVSTPPSLVLASNAVVMNSGSLDGLSGISAMGDGTNNMVFTNPTTQMQGVKPGDVLVSDYSGFSTDEGLLQKVISVASIGNELHFQTVQATLEDAIENCSIEFFGRLNDQPPASIRARGKRPFIGQQTYGVEMVNIQEIVASNGVSLNFDLSIKPTMYVKLHIESREIKEFTVFFEVNENAKASISADKDLSIGWKGQTVPIYLTKFYLPVGGILGGIPITLWGKIVYAVEGFAKAGLKVGFEQSLQAGIGATRLNGVWSKKEKFENSFTPYIETSADVSCKLAAGPRIDAYVFGLKGPYVTLWGYGRLEAYPNQRLFAGLDADLGVQIDVTRSLKFEKTFNFNLLEKQIWEKKTLINLEPVVNIIFPSDNAEFTLGSSLTIKAVANDSGGGYVTRVSFFQGEKLIGFDDAAPYENEWPSLPAGTHFLTAKAKDNSGAQTISGNVRIIVKEPAVGPVGPPVALSPGEDSSHGLLETLRPIFRWTPISGVQKFGLYIRDTVDNKLVFEAAKNGTVTGTAHQLPAGILEEGKQYRWAVTSFVGDNESAQQSEYKFFQTRPLIPQPNFKELREYSSDDNPFWTSGNAPLITYNSRPGNYDLGEALGNCTWYAFGRMLQLGFSKTEMAAFTGDANKWDDLAAPGQILTGPQVHTIAQKDGTWGHVAIVEKLLENGNILVSESSYVDKPLADTMWSFLYRTRVSPQTSFDRFIKVSKAPSSQPPTLLEPGISSVAGLSVETLTPKFRWETVSGAKSYRIYISKNPDTGTIFNTTVETPPFAGLPPGTLQNGNKYQWKMTSFVNGVESVKSNPLYFETPAAQDITAPSISNISTQNITQTSAVITWATNEYSTSQVEYGPNSAGELTTTLDTDLVKSHSVSLAGLKPSITYKFRVKSKDSSGNFRASADVSFVTLSTPVSALGEFASQLTYSAFWDSSPPPGPAVKLSWGSVTGARIYEIWRNDNYYNKTEGTYFKND